MILMYHYHSYVYPMCYKLSDCVQSGNVIIVQRYAHAAL